MSNYKHIKQRGFTLIELMVTIAVAAIIAALAAPSFLQTIASSKLTSATNDLYTALVQARSDSLRQGERVTVCVSSDGATCATTTVTWSVGWITFVDGTRTSLATVDAGETVSYIAQPTDPAIVIQGNANFINYASFSPDGKSKAINGAFQAGVIRVCSTSGALSDDRRARELVVNNAGRISIRAPTTNPDITCPSP
jgi:type IV fimbrial biogenesis protein FimT